MALAGCGRHTEYTKYTDNAHNETFTLHSCAISRESFMQMFYAKICVPGRRLDDLQVGGDRELGEVRAGGACAAAFS